MAQLRIDTPDFALNSSYKCGTECEWRYTDSTHTDYTFRESAYVEKTSNTARHTARFELSALPEGAKITQATLFATAGSPLHGTELSTINGVSVTPPGTKTVPVDVEDGATSVDVVFAYKCVATAHNHYADGYHVNGGDYWDGNTLVHHLYYDHESVVAYTDVYLLIEYTPAFTPPELIPYTDPAPVAGETYVKAVHMTELHTNANLVREAYNLPAYDFPAITAMESLLAGWNADVIEIRVALDAIGVTHEDWLLLDFNRPRLDVLLQLRRVVAALAAGDGEQVEAVREQFYTADGELMATADGLYFKVLEGTT